MSVTHLVFSILGTGNSHSLRFQSDHDYDRIQELSGEAGVLPLEHEAVGEAIARGKRVKMVSDLDRHQEAQVQKVEDDLNKQAVKYAKAELKKGRLPHNGDEIPKVPMHYAIYAGVCSDPVKIRKHLDSGILAKMIAEAEKKLRPSYDGTYDSDGYNFILLGACAMSLGCKLPISTLPLMRKHFKNIGLMRDAKTQM